VAKNEGSQNQKRMVVTIHHAATPDGSARISRAISVLLKAAEEANSQSKDTSNGKKEAPHGQATAKDALTRSNGGNNSNDTGITQTQR